MTDDEEVYRTAVNILRASGHAKGSFWLGTSHCLLGAVGRARLQLRVGVENAADADPGMEWLEDDATKLGGVVAAQYPEFAEPSVGGYKLRTAFAVVTNFNDDPDITVDDVIAVLEKAAVSGG